MDFLRRAFGCFDRTWVAAQRSGEDGDKGVYPIFVLAFYKWRSNLTLCARFVDTIVHLNYHERSGSTAIAELLSEAFTTLQSIHTRWAEYGLDHYISHPPGGDFAQSFEMPLTAATHKYYKIVASRITAGSGIEELV
ncbi:uncharacterized protein FIBRA_06981 [Fibroporia radiculosa]|uniref:Uncharacterized protein n=1 Tax=Fibroporia radiculosa TaxID=599839 RepID=J4GD25_9APHY|nr:uncharacterized protein FIBRA_06981 [Fibroporia radiculosa]CCM04788.1 predicted protein [Fibroporia radiculosa]